MTADKHMKQSKRDLYSNLEQITTAVASLWCHEWLTVNNSAKQECSKKDAYQLNHYRELSLQQFQLGVAILTYFYSAMQSAAPKVIHLLPGEHGEILGRKCFVNTYAHNVRLNWVNWESHDLRWSVAVCLLLSVHHAVIFAIAQLSCSTSQTNTAEN